MIVTADYGPMAALSVALMTGPTARLYSRSAPGFTLATSPRSYSPWPRKDLATSRRRISPASAR